MARRGHLSKVYVSFIGGNATSVTGSCTLVEFRGRRILLELGIHQEGTMLENYRSNEALLNSIDFTTIDYIILCDPHADHSGLLPAPFSRGFKGKVIMTPSAFRITKWMLEDSAHIMSGDSDWLLKKKGVVVKPHYVSEDVSTMLDNTIQLDTNTEFKLGTSIIMEYMRNGHNAGSASLTITFLDESGRRKKMFYSSDLGNTAVNMPFVSETIDRVKTADIAIFESTYGTKPEIKISQSLRRTELYKLRDAIVDTVSVGGTVICPVFAFQRSQQFLWHLKTLFDKTPSLANTKVVVDGRLMKNISKEFLSILEGKQLEDFESLMNWKNLVTINDYQDTLAVLGDSSPKVIVASSGMASNGKVVAYLEKYVGKSDTMIIFNGYCSQNSVGAKLLEKLTNPDKGYVQIGDKTHHYRAQVMRLYSFSSHMQYNELIETITKMNVSKGIYLVHGSKESRDELARAVTEELSVKNKTTPIKAIRRNAKIEF